MYRYTRRVDGEWRHEEKLIFNKREISEGEDSLIGLDEPWRPGDWIEIVIKPWFVSTGPRVEMGRDVTIMTLSPAHLRAMPGHTFEGESSVVRIGAADDPGQTGFESLRPRWELRLDLNLDSRKIAVARMTRRWKRSWLDGGMTFLSMTAWR